MVKDGSEIPVPVADTHCETGGVDEVKGVGEEPRFFEVVDEEGAVGWDP